MLAQVHPPATAIDSPVPHPLDPLAPHELAQAVSILRAAGRLGSGTRIVKVELDEPPKLVVLNYPNGDAIERRAFAIVLDSGANATYEAVVSLTEKRLISYRHVPGVQPSLTIEEFEACAEAVRNDI